MLKKTVALAVVPLAFLVVACDGDGLELPVGTEAPGDPEETQPAEETEPPPEETEAPPEETEAPPEETEAPPEETEAPPEETEAPPEETEAPPEETEAPPEETTAPDDESDDGGNTALIVLAIIAAAGLLVAVIALATRRKSTPAPASDPRRQVVATARWVHDQLSLELLALPPVESQQRWAVERSRLDRLVIDTRTISPDRNAPQAWETLAQSVAALQSQLDTAIRLRATPGADADLVRESVDLANGRRAELQQALLVVQQL